MPSPNGAPPQLTCPRDGSALKGSLVGGLLVDRCPECRGIWFDKLEVEFLTRALDERQNDTRHGIINSLIDFLG